MNAGRKFLSFFLMFFCWMYFTHAAPLSLMNLAMNQSYGASQLGSDMNVTQNFYAHADDHDSSQDPFVPAKRIRKRRHSDLTDHLQKQIAQVSNTKSLIQYSVLDFSVHRSGAYPESEVSFISHDPAPLLPPPKV